jgi:hypothetical protein
LAILEVESIVVGTAGGSIVGLPDRSKVFEGNEGGWYRLTTFRQIIGAVSKRQKIVIVSELKSVICF